MLVNVEGIVKYSMLNLDYANFILPRGGGKSFLIGEYINTCHSQIEDKRIVITSPTVRQIKLVFREIENFGFKTHNLNFTCGRRNSISIKGLPLNEIKPENLDTLIIDNGETVYPEFLEKVIDWVEGNKVEKVFIMSTGYTSECPMMKVNESEHFSTLSFGHKAYPSRYFFDEDLMKQIKETFDPITFDLEFNSKIKRGLLIR